MSALEDTLAENVCRQAAKVLASMAQKAHKDGDDVNALMVGAGAAALAVLVANGGATNEFVVAVRDGLGITRDSLAAEVLRKLAEVGR